MADQCRVISHATINADRTSPPPTVNSRICDPDYVRGLTAAGRDRTRESGQSERPVAYVREPRE